MTYSLVNNSTGEILESNSYIDFIKRASEATNIREEMLDVMITMGHPIKGWSVEMGRIRH